MGVNYAGFQSNQAYLWTDFGLRLAQKYFTEEEINMLPRFSRGKRKGLIKGQIQWTKVSQGGWVREGLSGYAENRIGQIVEIELCTAEFRQAPDVIASREFPKNRPVIAWRKIENGGN